MDTMIESIRGQRLAHFHPFQVGKKDYIFLVPTSSIIELDELASKIVKGFKRASAASLPALLKRWEKSQSSEEMGEALDELKKVGLLRAVSGDEPMGLPPPPVRLQTMVLILTEQCNLKCAYCYFGQKRRKKGASMGMEVARAALSLLLSNSHGLREVKVVLFGGEPLLSYPMVEAIVEEGQREAAKQGKRINFSITTNGSLLTEEMAAFFEEKKVGLTISIDGPEEVHDPMRGDKSHQALASRLRELQKIYKSRPLSARVTLTRGGAKVRQIFRHLEAMGFSEVGFAPVTTDNEAFQLTQEDLEHLEEEFEALALRYLQSALKGEYLGFSNLSNLLEQLHQGVIRPLPCGAGLGLWSVGPEGNIYLCHRLSGQEKFSLGHVQRGVDFSALRGLIEEVLRERRGVCAPCWLKYLCAGGCYHEAQTRWGHHSLPNLHYCQWLRRWVHKTLKVYATLMESRPDFIENLSSIRAIQETRDRKQETEYRKQNTGNRIQEAGKRKGLIP